MINLYKYMGMKSVKNIEDRLFAVIQKIMNESIEASYISQYDNFNKLKNISNKIIAVLDAGDYIDNAKVIRDLDRLIYKYEIFTMIPNLDNKHIVSIQSDQNSFCEFINKSIVDHLNYDVSINIPYIILPYCESFCANSVYILSYCNKIVELTIDEYKLICTELYKYNIDIKKLIKCFFSYQSRVTTNTCFVYFPLDMDIENTVYCQLKDKITVSVFIGNEIFKNKLYYNSFYFLGSKSEYKKFFHVYKSKYIKCISYKNLIDRIKKFDNVFYNYNIAQEIDLLLLEVKKFYINSLNRLSNILKGIKTDLLRIQDDKLKEQLQYYYEYKQIEYDELSISKNKFCKFYSEILNYILNNGLSNDYYDINLLNLDNNRVTEDFELEANEIGKFLDFNGNKIKDRKELKKFDTNKIYFDGENIIKHRAFYNIKKYGMLNLLEKISDEAKYKISIEELKNYSNKKNEIEKNHTTQENLHRKYARPRKDEKFTDEDYKKYEKAIRNIQQYTHLKNKVEFNELNLLQSLLLRILHRLVGYTSIWERDLRFRLKGEFPENQYIEEIFNFDNSKNVKYKNGQIVEKYINFYKELYKDDTEKISIYSDKKVKELKKEKKDLYIRNYIAHFNYIPHAEISLLEVLENLRKLLSYDRKLKNAVMKSVVDILKEYGFVVKFKIGADKKIEIQSLKSEEIVHLKKLKLKDNDKKKEPIKTYRNSKELCKLVKVMFEYKMEEKSSEK